MYKSYGFVIKNVFLSLCYLIIGFQASATHLPVENEGLLQSATHWRSKWNVAIIGAGAAGSSTAYHLRQFANKAGLDINITVFEKNNYIGGRVATAYVYDDIFQPTELGSTLFVEANSILMNATNKFNLALGSIADDDSFGVWNGHDIVFVQESDTSPSWDRIKLILKYGLAPLKTENLKNKILGQFQKLYEYPFFPFKSLTSGVKDIGLSSITNITGSELLEKNDIQGPYIEEIIQPSARVAFGQSPHKMHGLQTLVSMAVEGAISIIGGNHKIFQEMIKTSNSSVFLNTSVKNISTSNFEKGYKISWLENVKKSNESNILSELFDSVVLTTPIQFSNISLNDVTLKRKPKQISYLPVHVTLFTSPHSLNPAYFNIPLSKSVPATIITTSQPKSSIIPQNLENESASTIKKTLDFISITKVRKTFNPASRQLEHLYKIFSLEAVNAKLLSNLLNTTMATNFTTSPDTISWYYPYVWENAYPYAYPCDQFDESELAPSFWYTSGIESFVSTMETSALMGMNVARLIIDGYQQTINTHKESFVYQPAQFGI
ncbi:hypothetical protein EPUL_003868 [Erysiphe pulchra]|uniref:Prenylcysteine lyase domain-containing protein n=1 Tax=Erysiphe pulchra TaxID=225359 RepID=A0A2S4PR42_9PEZI|nr:hypothetical protein EPUL_003868 [Erysiphe pulchra]